MVRNLRLIVLESLQQLLESLRLRRDSICLWGGASVSPNLPQLPKLEFAQSPYSAQYQLFKADGRNFKGYKYFISDNQNNLMKEGITDEYGFTEQVVTETRERIIGYKSVMRESERLTENWEAKLEEKSKKLESELDGG